jgi:hypothetical protein
LARPALAKHPEGHRTVRDRSDEYLAAAAECLALGRVITDPVTRVKLLTLAEKWYGLANGSAHANLNAALMAFNDRQLDPAADTHPVAQQQQNLNSKLKPMRN